MNEEELRKLREDFIKDFPLRGRYKPGLEWTIPMALPQNIVTSLVQMQNDIEKGNIRHEHDRLRRDLEKDFPSDGSKRDPKANARLKAIPEEFRMADLINRAESNSADDVKQEQVNKIIPQLPEGVSQKDHDAWSNKRIKEELRQNIDDPRYDAKREAFKRVPELQNRNFKNRERGGSRWVGVNSEWRDRYDNVIAPRENFNSSVDRKGEPISVNKQMPKINKS